MSDICVTTGVEYRGEFIHTLASGQVVVYPSWLGGQVQAEFLNHNEAMNFIDAKHALSCVLAADSLAGVGL